MANKQYPVPQSSTPGGSGSGTVTGGPFTSGDVITGAGGQAIQDSGTTLASITPSSLLSPFGTVALPNMAANQIYQTNLSIGDHALYTVPANKKAIVAIAVYNNSGVAAIACTPKVSFNSGSTYIPINGSTSPANGATSTIFYGYVFSAGDVVGLTTATNNNANVFGTAYTFDSTSPIKTVTKTSFTDGDNTLYTVPAGKTAFSVFGYGPLFSFGANNPTMVAVTSASVAIKINFVLSGGSVATTNQVFGATINNVASGTGQFITLNAGDFVNVNTATGANTTLAFITVLEQ